jgi:hypothetical protein
MDLNPVTFEPSACIPQRPRTDLIEILKIYGEAEDTVLVESDTVEPDGEGNAFVGGFGASYVNEVGSPSLSTDKTSVTRKEPL